jgi:hypothetical protein
MQLGKSLVGAIIGAALGIGLLILINALTAWDKYWLAIPVAILTGLGVRWVADTNGHPSYVRGVLTGVIAILAFMLGQYAVAKVATLRSEAKPIVAQLDDVRAADQVDNADTNEADDAGDAEAADDIADDAADEGDLTDEAAAITEDNTAADADAPTGVETEPAAEPEARGQPAADGPEAPAPLPDGPRPLRVQQWTTWDLISLCIAALVGYALGRGSDSPAVRTRDDNAPMAPNPAMPPSD